VEEATASAIRADSRTNTGSESPRIHAIDPTCHRENAYAPRRMPASARMLLAGFAALLLLASPAGASTNGYLDRIRDDPIALNQFMVQLPKGGDIHSHLSGPFTPSR
jgi:hypothetical protein